MKCVIFDLDGTLLYTLEDLFNAVNYTLEHFGYKKRTLEEVRNFVGNGIRKLLERSLDNSYDEAELKLMLGVFMEYYSKNAAKCTRPYDGIEEVLKFLKEKGVKIAVNSNKYDDAVKKLCEKYFKGYILSAAGEIPPIPRKPAPDGIFRILRELNCKREDSVFVGDSLVDIQTAKNANIPCISVSWGYCPKNVLVSNNKYIANTPAELKKLLEQILTIK